MPDRNPRPGFRCPVCDSWTDVIATRPGAYGLLNRRRRCANDHRFSTEERIKPNGRVTTAKDK